MCYDGHTQSFNGHRKAYWVLNQAQDGQTEAYNRCKTPNMSLAPVPTGILGLAVTIGKPYTATMGLKPVKTTILSLVMAIGKCHGPYIGNGKPSWALYRA